MKGSHGKMSGTRRKLKKGEKEKITPTRYLKHFDEGDMIQIKIDSSSHRGMPHPRFQGRVGEVIGKKGKSYRLKVKDKNKEKELVVSPEHLKGIDSKK